MFFIFIFILLQNIKNSLGLDNGLALTPPMGWMTWQRYRCSIDCSIFKNDCLNEKLVIDTADKMVELGLQKAGYEYIIIDDCWAEKERDENGELQANKQRFPHGLKYLVDYIHKLGLKFGIYADFGTFTCAHYPGSEFYIKTDAITFARWGVDYVKMDGCYADPIQMNDGYPEFSKWLNRTSRPIVFSCSWPDYQETKQANYSYIARYCNLWRNYIDIQDSWPSAQAIIKFYGDRQRLLVPAAGPGHWNDPDMLLIGNFGLSRAQAQTQMAFWCLLSAPLLMSTDLRNIEKDMLDILLNSQAISINQDRLGLQGARIYTDGSLEVWLKPLTPISLDKFEQENSMDWRQLLMDHTALLLYNSGESGAPKPYNFKPRSLGYTRHLGYRTRFIFGQQYQYDPLNGDDYQILLPDSNVTYMVPPSGCVFLRLSAILY